MQGTWIFGAGLLILGIYNLFKILERVFFMASSRDWNSITGTVINRFITDARTDKGKWYVPQVTYTYSVMGVEYKKTIDLGVKISSKSAINSLNKIEETVSLRYNPLDPEKHISTEEKVRLFDILWIVIPSVIGLCILSGVILEYKNPGTTP